jgi:hypothetical protein
VSIEQDVEEDVGGLVTANRWLMLGSWMEEVSLPWCIMLKGNWVVGRYCTSMLWFGLLG